MKWHYIPGIEPTETPFIKKVKVAGKSICIISNEGKLYATSATCPHAGAELSGGWCANGMLVCPFHRYTYNLQTGKGSPGQNDYIDVYPVEVRGKDIYVGIQSLWEKLFSK